MLGFTRVQSEHALAVDKCARKSLGPAKIVPEQKFTYKKLPVVHEKVEEIAGHGVGVGLEA